MTSTSVGWVLVDGREADGAPLDHDAFDVRTDAAFADGCTSRHAAAARGAQKIATVSGHQVHSIAVTWSDDVDTEARLLLESLSDSGFDNVVSVRLPQAIQAFAQGVGRAIGYETTAVCVVGPDAATVLVSGSGDGAVPIAVTHTRGSGASLVEWLTSIFDRDGWQPEGLFMVGSRSDLDAITGSLEDGLAMPVFASAEAQLALARGAARAVSQNADVADLVDSRRDVNAFTGCLEDALALPVFAAAEAPSTLTSTLTRGGEPPAAPNGFVTDLADPDHAEVTGSSEETAVMPVVASAEAPSTFAPDAEPPVAPNGFVTDLADPDHAEVTGSSEEAVAAPAVAWAEAPSTFAPDAEPPVAPNGLVTDLADPDHAEVTGSSEEAVAAPAVAPAEAPLSPARGAEQSVVLDAAAPAADELAAGPAAKTAAADETGGTSGAAVHMTVDEWLGIARSGRGPSWLRSHVGLSTVLVAGVVAVAIALFVLGPRLAPLKNSTPAEHRPTAPPASAQALPPASVPRPAPQLQPPDADSLPAPQLQPPAVEAPPAPIAAAAPPAPVPAAAPPAPIAAAAPPASVAAPPRDISGQQPAGQPAAAPVPPIAPPPDAPEPVDQPPPPPDPVQAILGPFMAGLT